MSHHIFVLKLLKNLDYFGNNSNFLQNYEIKIICG